MRKYCIILALLCVLVLLSACNLNISETSVGEQASEDDIKWDYRPMVFFQNKLYGETGDFFKELPIDAASADIEAVLMQGKQYEPMKYEEGYSNSLPIGTKIYTSDDENIIYAEIVHASGGEGYILYKKLEDERGE